MENFLRAAITATEARELAEVAKRVPPEKEARTRAIAGVREADGKLPRHTGTKVDQIPLENDGTMTFAGHAFQTFFSVQLEPNCSNTFTLVW